MQPIQHHLHRISSPKRIANTLPITVLIAIAGLTAIFIAFSTTPNTVSADPLDSQYEPWLEINCLETVVEEGDDFQLQVNKKFDSEWPHKTMKVWWYTNPITADQSDYRHVHQERQLSNGYQSKHGRMSRTFHTLEDLHPEPDETFQVKFLNGVSKGHDGQCEITIEDNDGIGIQYLEITSQPRRLPTSPGAKPRVGYTAGDNIEITAHFTGDVTTVNPDTGEPSDYAGIHIYVGKQRRFAPFLRSYGPDALVFSYTVQPDDIDRNGISVEPGGVTANRSNTWVPTGFHYDRQHRDIGIWPSSLEHDDVNRFYLGLDNQPGHRVFQTQSQENDPTTTTEPQSPTGPQSTPNPRTEDSVAIEDSSFHIEHGELTQEDNGQDWFSFTATGGQNYIIEAEGRVRLLDDGTAPYVDNHLKDPSILEILDHEGNQLMGEQDQGGFIHNWARAYFQPEIDGTYHFAVGSGRQDRGGLGHYTIAIRQDDHADDWRTNPEITLLPNQSITARIDSDVAPENTNLNAWAWAQTDDDHAVPRWGIESQDDKDVFRFEIPEAREYIVAITEGPAEIGIWAFFDENGNGEHTSREQPVRSITRHFQPGVHYVAVGTPYQSAGNTGSYTLQLSVIQRGPSDQGG